MTYTSNSQLARVLSEAWVAKHGYCLACKSDSLAQTTANTQVRDFECPSCNHAYELKSSRRPPGHRIVDGAFSSMMRRMESNTTPSFLLLQYSMEGVVTDLTAIHRSHITLEVVERRRPLTIHAQRAGWIGCNLLLGGIPSPARVSLLASGKIVPKEVARLRFAAAEKLSTAVSAEQKWGKALLRCVHQLPPKFSLNDVYQFECELAALYPANRNIRAKIRQQLQVLRDAGLIEFVSRGVYRRNFASNSSWLTTYVDPLQLASKQR